MNPKVNALKETFVMAEAAYRLAFSTEGDAELRKSLLRYAQSQLTIALQAIRQELGEPAPNTVQIEAEVEQPRARPRGPGPVSLADLDRDREWGRGCFR